MDRAEIHAHLQEEQDARTKAKLEARTKSLKTISSTLVKIHASLTVLPTVSRDRRTLILSQAIGRIRRLQDQGMPVGSARPVRQALNELVSMREADSTGTRLLKKDYVAVNLEAAISDIDATYETAKEKLAVFGKAQRTGVSSSPRDIKMEEIYKKAGEVIKRSQTESKDIDAIGDRSFAVARAPIVPVAQPFIDPAKFKRAGIKGDSIAGYAVIHNQMVVGINRSELQKKSRGKSETALEAAQRIVEVLSTKHRMNLQFATDKGYPYKGAVWYWVAPQRELDAIAKTAGGRLNVLQWGFAF